MLSASVPWLNPVNKTFNYIFLHNYIAVTENNFFFIYVSVYLSFIPYIVVYFLVYLL